MPVPAQNARASAALQAEFNTVGRLRTQVDEIIVPVAVVADLSNTGSTLVRKASAQFTQAAVAGQFTTWRLELPTGVLGSVKRIYCINNTASRSIGVFFGSSFPAPANAAAKAYMDGRLRASGQTPAGVLAFGTQVAALAVAHDQIQAHAPNLVNEIVVDWPFGRTNAFDFIEFQNEVANEQIRFAIEWVEFLPVI